MVGIGTMVGSTVGVMVRATLATQRRPRLHGLRRHRAGGHAALRGGQPRLLGASAIVPPSFSWRTFLSGFSISPSSTPTSPGPSPHDSCSSSGTSSCSPSSSHPHRLHRSAMAENQPHHGPAQPRRGGHHGHRGGDRRRWSDRIGRRKVFIYAASVFMVVGLVFPLLMPSVTGMLVMAPSTAWTSVSTWPATLRS